MNGARLTMPRMKQELPRRGRPPLPRGAGKAQTLRVRLRPVDYEQLKAAADAADTGLSEWAREALLSSLTRSTSKGGPLGSRARRGKM
jgi:hypothetical protein